MHVATLTHFLSSNNHSASGHWFRATTQIHLCQSISVLTCFMEPVNDKKAIKREYKGINHTINSLSSISTSKHHTIYDFTAFYCTYAWLSFHIEIYQCNKLNLLITHFTKYSRSPPLFWLHLNSLHPTENFPAAFSIQQK